MHKRGKKGQLTIFVIIAIIIVALVVLAIIFIPKMTKPKIPSSKALDPAVYVSDCINQELEPMVETLANQSGYFNQEHCIFYEGVCRRYLCYTNLPYMACVSQEPMLKEHIEQELKNKLQEQGTVSRCVSDFKQAAIQKDYETEICDNPSFNVTLIKGKVTVPITCQIKVSRAGEIKKFDQIVPALNWPLYEFTLVTKQIINDEIENTDFDAMLYMSLHPQIEIQKFRSSDGSKIYTLRERSSNKKFVFAVRNWVIPPGIM